MPSVAHACAVWFHTSEPDLKILESIQYRAAKAVIKTKSKPVARFTERLITYLSPKTYLTTHLRPKTCLILKICIKTCPKNILNVN